MKEIQLNQEQLTAVRASDGPTRVIAGAGTGKTKTLIARVLFLVKERRVEPSKVAAITFTNKAAHEMATRLAEEGLREVAATTFHALAAKILKEKYPDLKIISEVETEIILKDLIKTEENLKKVKSALEFLRSGDAGPERPEVSIPPDRLQEILKKYQQILTKNNQTDFTGLLTGLWELWKGRPETLNEARKKYSHILVDEFQDVNQIQTKIVFRLAEPEQNIFVVGDPDQTIYSWRGARSETMNQFLEKYPQAKTIILKTNYRNPECILRGAGNLIAHNSGRITKGLIPAVAKTGDDSPFDQRTKLWTSRSTMEWEAQISHLLETRLGSQGNMYLADKFDSGQNHEWAFEDLAFLYRTQHEGQRLANLLDRRGYPFQMSSPESFWKSEVINNLLKYIEEAIVLEKEENEGAFYEWFENWLKSFLTTKSFTATDLKNLEKLKNYAHIFSWMKTKAGKEALLIEAKTEQEADNIVADGAINLLTLHAAKGLEFPVVMILGLEEGRLPQAKQSRDRYWLEEERRLFYVGMTRATAELHLFYCQQGHRQPSRFLREIGDRWVSRGQLPGKKAKALRKKQIKKAQTKLF